MIAALGFVMCYGFPAFADRDAGREVFRQHCIGCHSIACDRNGPRLGGLIGRRAGTVAGFAGYSEAMKKSGIVWNRDLLNAYLTDPTSVVAENAMAAFGKIENESDRRSLIDFLVEPDRTLDLCS